MQNTILYPRRVVYTNRLNRAQYVGEEGGKTKKKKKIEIPKSKRNIFTCNRFWTLNDFRTSHVFPLTVLGVTTMLNYFSTSNSFRRTLPDVSNLTAMNVWDGVCVCFVFASFVEFIIVNSMGRRKFELKSSCNSGNCSISKVRVYRRVNFQISSVARPAGFGHKLEFDLSAKLNYIPYGV